MHPNMPDHPHHEPTLPPEGQTDEAYQREREQFFHSPVERLVPLACTSTTQLFHAMARASGPLRNLAGVYLGWEEMLSKPDQAVWLTIAGAYIPFGLGGTLRTIIEQRLVDFIVTTPA